MKEKEKITFTISLQRMSGTTKTYTVNEGTTWEEWLNEQGLKDGFFVLSESTHFPSYNGCIMNPDGFAVMGPVFPDDIIESGFYEENDVM